MIPAAFTLGAPEPDPLPAVKSEPPSFDPLLHEIGALLGEFYAAYDQREWSRAEGCFWPDATITEVRAREGSARAEVLVLSAPEFFAGLERAEVGKAGSFVGRPAQVPELRVAGNVAQAWCRYAASFGGPEEVMEWHRYDAFIFVQHDGRWRIAALVQSLSIDSH